jgi:TPR repeat protein
LEKGNETLKNGNVVVARQFYQRAAGSGLPEAAMAMAATYDAHELARMEGVFGVQPDTAMAKKWYEEAWQLGARDAESRLGRLR